MIILKSSIPVDDFGLSREHWFHMGFWPSMLSCTCTLHTAYHLSTGHQSHTQWAGIQFCHLLDYHGSQFYMSIMVHDAAQCIQHFVHRQLDHHMHSDIQPDPQHFLCIFLYHCSRYLFGIELPAHKYYSGRTGKLDSCHLTYKSAGKHLEYRADHWYIHGHWYTQLQVGKILCITVMQRTL